jgi:hypothetical protein
LICRYASDKIAIIREKVKSFGDFEDVLIDARLSEEESTQVFNILGDVEIAVLLKRHPFQSAIEAVELTGSRTIISVILKRYVEQLSADGGRKAFWK